MLRRLVIAAIAAAVAAVFLVATDQRLLIWETKVAPGERYEVPGHGDLGRSQQPARVCRYFTGRGIVTTVRTGGGDCPFLAANA